MSSSDFVKFNKILKNKKIKKPPKYEWQDFALKIIDELGVPKHKRSAVFKVCKQYPRDYAEKCLNDTKELCRQGEAWRYFFKLIDLKN